MNNVNSINVLRTEPYDGKLIAARFNIDPHNAFPTTGDDSAVVRLDPPVYTNFSKDASFHAGNSVLIDWGSYQAGVNVRGSCARASVAHRVTLFATHGLAITTIRWERPCPVRLAYRCRRSPLGGLNSHDWSMFIIAF